MSKELLEELEELAAGAVCLFGAEDGATELIKQAAQEIRRLEEAAEILNRNYWAWRERGEKYEAALKKIEQLASQQYQAFYSPGTNEKIMHIARNANKKQNNPTTQKVKP